MAVPPRHVEAQMPPHGPGMRLAQPGLVGLTWGRPHELRYDMNLTYTGVYDIDMERNDEHWRGFLNEYVKYGNISSTYAHSVLSRVQFRRGLAQYKLSRYRMIGRSSDGLVEVKYSPVGEIIELLIDPRVDGLPERERYDHILAAISDAAVKGRKIASEENKQLNDDIFRMLMDPLIGDEVDQYFNDNLEPAERVRLLPSDSEVKRDLYQHSKAQDGELEDLEEYDSSKQQMKHEAKATDSSKDSSSFAGKSLLDIVEQAMENSWGDPAMQALQVKEKSKEAAQDVARSVRNNKELNQVLNSLEDDLDKQTHTIAQLSERLQKATEKKEQLSRKNILGTVSPKTGSLKQQLWRRSGMTDLDMSNLLTMKVDQHVERANVQFQEFADNMMEELSKEEKRNSKKDNDDDDDDNEYK